MHFVGTQPYGYSGLSNRVRGPLHLSTSVLHTQKLPGIDEFFPNSIFTKALKNEPIKSEQFSLPPTPISGQSSPLPLSPGQLPTLPKCRDCGINSIFKASPICDDCMASSETSSHTLESRASASSPRSGSYDASCNASMASLHRTMDGRISKPSSVPDRRPSVGSYFWSPRRADTRPDEGIGTDLGMTPSSDGSSSRSSIKRVGKARREAESRAKQGELLKLHEDWILQSEWAGKLCDTTELNSNNAQKSGLTYRKEMVLETSLECHVTQQERIAGLMETLERKTEELLELECEHAKYEDFLTAFMVEVQVPADSALAEKVRRLSYRLTAPESKRQSKL